MKINDWLDNKLVGPLQLAALITWLVVSWFSLFLPIEDAAARLPAGLALIGFLLAMFTAWGASSSLFHMVGLVAMPASLLVASWYQPATLHLVFMCIFAGTLPYFFSAVFSLFAVALVHFAVAGLIYLRTGDTDVWLYSLTYLGFAVFALFSSYSVMRERSAREELDQVHQELLATQQKLTERAIEDERLRISRDLHDSLGHHLTALSLQLEVARHRADEQVRQNIDQAQSLTKLLLGDVRQVVADLRTIPQDNFAASLAHLADTARAEVVLHGMNNDPPPNPQVSETLFRVIQEIITNCNRHSTCTQLTIRLERSEKGWQLLARENLRAPVMISTKNGLKGMRERIERLGGTLHLETGAGLSHRIYLPQYD